MTKKPTIRKTVVKQPARTDKFSRQVFNLAGEEVGTATLPKEIFGAPVNEKLLLQAIRVYQANLRQGTSSTKTRGLVRGGGRKPWKQKGTGRARQGSIRSPQWRGGGVIFGPKPRDYSLNLPAKLKKQALRSALSSKVDDVLIIEKISLREPKTKKVALALKKLNLSGRTLFVLSEREAGFELASRNIPTVKLSQVDNLNTWEVLTADKLVLAQDSLAKLAEKK